ncbi:GNAT family N-acetyltransferase [Arthrobacter tecti]
MLEITVREATEADWPALAELRAKWAAEQLGARQNHERNDDGTTFESVFSEWAASNPRITFLAERDGAALGMVNFLVFNRMPKPGAPPSCWVYVGNAFVLPDERNRRIGGALMESALERARALGAVRVVLSPSTQSIPFYERLGFTPATALMMQNL